MGKTKQITPTEAKERALTIITSFLEQGILFSARSYSSTVMRDSTPIDTHPKPVKVFEITCKIDADNAKVHFGKEFEIGLDKAGQRLAIARFYI